MGTTKRLSRKNKASRRKTRTEPMKLTKEQIERAKTVNLPQFLMANGFELKKTAKSMYGKNTTACTSGITVRVSRENGSGSARIKAVTISHLSVNIWADPLSRLWKC